MADRDSIKNNSVYGLQSFFHDKSISTAYKTLHESRGCNFNKTSSGKIYESDIKDIYAMMLICLDLKETSIGRSKFPFWSKASYPYSFFLDGAMHTMKQMKVCVDFTMTSTIVSYNIGSELSLALIKKFYDAKLLHSPADRTRSQPKTGVALQPTPKGVAILRDFCKKIGMKRENLPQILRSSFNSMDLFKFDRDSISDKILYSDYFLHLLFIKLMGNAPNVWTIENKPDSLPSFYNNADVDCCSEFNTFEGLTGDSIATVANGFDLVNSNLPTFSEESNSDTTSKTSTFVSTFYHRYFTNPESDSHVQYYVSSTGVRLYKNKVFKQKEGNDLILDYCVTGKAICQWLADCTDVISIRHSIEISNLLLKAGLIVPLNLNDEKKPFSADRNSIYILSKLGYQVCYWNKELAISPNELSVRVLNSVNYNDFVSNSVDTFIESISSPKKQFYASDKNSQNIFLKDILKDPGMRYAFKKHLENEFCAENLDAYLQLKQYAKKINILSKLIRLRKSDDPRNNEQKLNSQIIRLANICLSLAYHIYFTYLSSEAPFVLNIDYNLRASITSILIRPDTSIAEISQSFLKTPTVPSAGPFENIQIEIIPKENSITGSFLSSMASLNKSQIRENEIETISSDTNIKSQNITYIKSEELPPSPSEIMISATLDNLAQISITFEDILRHIFRLMEVDSLPKFLNSSIYRNSTSTISLKKR